MTNLNELSRLCGVSVATASKAINGKPGVNADTRKRVLSIAKQFNYRPNRLVHSIQSGRSMTVGITCNHLCDEFMGAVMDGMLSVLYHAKYDALIISWDMSVEDGEHILRTLAERRVDGILMCPPSKPPSLAYLKELQTFRGPTVVVDQTIPSFDYDYVGSQDLEGAQKATEHLIELGHRKIANISHKNVSTGMLRHEGYQQAMMKHGVPIHRKWLRDIETWNSNDAYDAASDLLSGEDPPTAIVAFNDFVAMQALSAAYDKKINVPLNLSIIGFADLSAVSHIRPALTTVAQTPQEIGRRAAGILLKRINADPELPLEPRLCERLPVSLIVRDTTAAPGLDS